MRPQRGSRARSTTGDSTMLAAAGAGFLAPRRPSRARPAPGSRCAPRPSGTGKCVASRRDEAVQRLLVEHHRDAEPRVLEQPFLDRVDELGVLRAAADVRSGRRSRRSRSAARAGRGPGRAAPGAPPGSKLPSASCNRLQRGPAAPSSCATFSSSVIRPSRSATRSATGRAASL